MEYRRGAHTVFEIHLHLVWITKYRRPALTGEIATRVRDLITGTPTATMVLKIAWANEKHADAESVFGSIADSIFENDKHVSGSFTFVHAEDKKGKVEVAITL